MSKPDWKDAPEWARWLAQDLAGGWWWYSREPVKFTEGFCQIQAGAIHGKASGGIVNSDWRSTLERRP